MRKKLKQERMVKSSLKALAFEGEFGGMMLEQLWNSGDFIGFVIDFALSQDQSTLTGPGTHQMNSLLTGSLVMTAPHGLAVNGNDLPSLHTKDPFHPARKALLERLGVQQ